MASSKNKRTGKQKFRFVVKGTFELEVEAASQLHARHSVWRALTNEQFALADIQLDTQPSRDWQIVKGSKR